MRKYREEQKNRKEWLIIAALGITIIGFIMRISCSFWGKPLQLHPDEGATVDYAVEMLQRHSWEAHSYDRPDHFEIKCDAIIFTVVSWLKYHQPAYAAFEEHKMAFYILARFFTALFGTALIPLVGVYSYKLLGFMKENFRKICSLLSMVMVAFSTVFVQHSAYATPDIVLTFFVVLFALNYLLFIKSGSKKALYLNIIIIGIGITIKYPAAVLSIPLAMMVIYRACLIDKTPKDIVKYALISIGLVFLTVFVLAPNLITDMTTVYINIMEEARPTHLGADGLGFWGNIKYYFKTINSELGTITTIPLLLGLASIVCARRRESLSLSVGLIYWLCISALSLHWLRWGIPVYPFYIILVAAGIGAAMQFLSDHLTAGSMLRIAGSAVVAVFSLVLFISVVLSGAAITKYSSLPEMRYVAMAYFNENGITKENSLYEGATPFAPNSSSQRVNAFSLCENGEVRVNIEYGTKQYFVMSNAFKSRYLAEPTRYPEQCAIYNGIESAYDIVYRKSGDGNYSVNRNLFRNIINTVRYLLKDQTATGNTITVYDLNPMRLTIQNQEGDYLAGTKGDESTLLSLSEDAYPWVLYQSDEGMALLSSENGLAIEVAEDEYQGRAGAELREPTGDQAQRWMVETEGDWSYLVFDSKFALSYDGDNLELVRYTRDENQKWKINY